MRYRILQMGCVRHIEAYECQLDSYHTLVGSYESIKRLK